MSISSKTWVILLSTTIREDTNMFFFFFPRGLVIFIIDSFDHISIEKLGNITHRFLGFCCLDHRKKVGCQHCNHKVSLPIIHNIFRIKSTLYLFIKLKYIHLFPQILTIRVYSTRVFQVSLT